MRSREWSKENVRRLVEGLGYPHLRGLLTAYDVVLSDRGPMPMEGLGDYFVMYDEPDAGVRHIRIQARGKEPIHNWMLMQEIKNLIWGPETIAVEVYPAASQFKDGSNTYHLWTWPGITVPNLLALYEYSS